jgi:hypothetical protein
MATKRKVQKKRSMVCVILQPAAQMRTHGGGMPEQKRKVKGSFLRVRKLCLDDE